MTDLELLEEKRKQLLNEIEALRNNIIGIEIAMDIVKRAERERGNKE